MNRCQLALQGAATASLVHRMLGSGSLLDGGRKTLVESLCLEILDFVEDKADGKLQRTRAMAV